MSVRQYLFSRPIIEEWGPPGRRLARRSTQRDLAVGLVLAAIVHLVVTLSGWGVNAILEGERAQQATMTLRILAYRELGTPPSIEPKPSGVPRFAIASPKFKPPPAGVPVPVPASAEPEATTIATQSQMPFADAVGDSGLGSGPAAGEGGSGGQGEGGGGGGGSGVIVPPVIVAMSWPEYPPEAKERPSVPIVLSVHVTEGGQVDGVEVLTPSDCPACERAAVASAWRLRCLPGTRDGKPLAMWMRFPVTFGRR